MWWCEECVIAGLARRTSGEDNQSVIKLYRHAFIYCDSLAQRIRVAILQIVSIGPELLSALTLAVSCTECLQALESHRRNSMLDRESRGEAGCEIAQ